MMVMDLLLTWSWLRCRSFWIQLAPGQLPDQHREAASPGDRQPPPRPQGGFGRRRNKCHRGASGASLPTPTRPCGLRAVLNSTEGTLQTFQRAEMENLLKASTWLPTAPPA